MSKVYPVDPAFAAHARITAADYTRLYAESLRDPGGFWREVARRLEWMKFPTRIKDTSFAREDFHIRWYADGVLNVA
ncbi:acetyl-coenzyme A synthetase N-terminal domain-containing protein, partial [Metallibacterium scheffleri]